VALIQPTLIVTEFIDFLAELSSSAEILSYKPSEKLQARLNYLLNKKLQETLTEDESLELQEFLRVTHFVGMLKVRVQRRLVEKGLANFS
jgi:hypothetical protein